MATQQNLKNLRFIIHPFYFNRARERALSKLCINIEHPYDYKDVRSFDSIMVMEKKHNIKRQRVYYVKKMDYLALVSSPYY
jgi:hypothetical protein